MPAFTLAPSAVPQVVPPGTIQNLSVSSSVLWSQTPNPANTDGVISPGAVWNSSGECYIRSDGTGTCSVVTSTDAGAGTSGSTNVIATVPGGVEITDISPSVTMPVTGDVGITGIVDIGTIAAGTVNINGNVAAINTQAYQTLYRNPVSVASANQATLLANVDVSTQQSVILNAYGGNSASYGMVLFGVYWLDSSGTGIGYEEFYMYGGSPGTSGVPNQIITPIKGPRMTVNVYVDTTYSGTWTGFCTILTSTLLLPEQYYNTPQSPAGTIYFNSGCTVTNQLLDVRSGSFQTVNIASTGTGLCTVLILIPSYSRLLNGTVYYTGASTSSSSTVALLAYTNYSPFNWPTLAAAQTLGLNYNPFTFISCQTPKRPLALYCYIQQATVQVSFAYERF